MPDDMKFDQNWSTDLVIYYFKSVDTQQWRRQWRGTLDLCHTTGFIQASMSKIQWLFKGFLTAPNKVTSNLYWFRALSTVLSPTKNSRIEGLFKALSDFPVLFKADLIFKDFSRKPSKFKYIF